MDKVSPQDIRDALNGDVLGEGEHQRYRHSVCAHRHNDRTLDIKYEGGSYVGYCHRCGSGSAWRVHNTPMGRNQATKGGVRGHKVGTGGRHDRTSEIGSFPAAAKLWLSRSRIEWGVLEGEGVRYNRTLECIEFPVPGSKHVIRRWYRSEMSKYTSRLRFQLRCAGRMSERGQTLVVVEDWMSCLQCSLAGYSALALFTTSIKTEALVQVLQNGYDEIIIGLDHDNTTVKENERRLLRKFSLVHNNVRVVYLEKDPKEFHIKELQEKLDAVNTG